MAQNLLFQDKHMTLFPSYKLKHTAWIILLGVIFLGILSGCGPSVRIHTDQDDSARFDQYVTYSFLDFTEGNKKTISEIELNRIRTEFAREIESRGLKFTEKEKDGDVSVQITVFHRQAMDNNSRSPRRYAYMERALAVDFYDNQTMTHVWHCAAVGELVYDPTERAYELPKVVAKIFEKYPLKSSTHN